MTEVDKINENIGKLKEEAENISDKINQLKSLRKLYEALEKAGIDVSYDLNALWIGYEVEIKPLLLGYRLYSFKYKISEVVYTTQKVVEELKAYIRNNPDCYNMPHPDCYNMP